MSAAVSNLLTPKKSVVYTIFQEASVLDAVHEMNRLRIGSIVVLDGERLAGIFTERDVLQRVVAEGKSPDETLVSDVMTKEVETITPQSTVEEAMRAMTVRRHRHLPVMDDGKMVGLVSIGDVTRWISWANENEAENLRSYITGGY
jgi:CBS domain-containing protein